VPTHAAGGVLWRPGTYDKPTIRIALIHRPRYDDWSLPKGKLKPREETLLGAVREATEETGHTVYAQQRLAALCYRTGTTVKEVWYWSMRAGSGTFTASDEVDQLRWHGPKKALNRLTYAADRDLLEEFLQAPRPTSIVILARHASAGKRASWPHPDELRPLDRAGRRDARSVATLMTAFGPEAVYTADLVRCRQTAAFVGSALDRPVRDVPALSDESYSMRPDEAQRAFFDLAERHEVSYLCSQGDAIPGLLKDIGVRRDVDTKKGTFWVIGVRGEEVLFADYYRRPGS
jgi:8-oxo-(d)GTP phosphatase